MTSIENCPEDSITTVARPLDVFPILLVTSYYIMHNKAFSWKKKSPEIERQPAYVCAFVRAIVHAHR